MKNVTILIATGIHDLHTHEQNLIVYGEEMCRRFRIISHDAMIPQCYHTKASCLRDTTIG